MQENLRQYWNKLNRMQQNQKQDMERIRQQYMNEIKKQLQYSADNHWKRYQLNKNKLVQEIETVGYYMKLASIGTKNRQQLQQLQIQQKDRSMFAQSIKNVNLYSLFKSIDDKLIFNHALLHDFKFTCSLPKKSINHLQNLINHSKIQQEQIYQYSNLITNLLTKLNKPYKQYHHHYLTIQQKYTHLLKTHHKQNNTQLKLKDSLSFVVSSLLGHKYLKIVDLSIVNTQGIVSCQEYDRLGSALLSHQFYLKNINIRLMDMQFCQQKCDTIKRYMKKLKVLQKLLIKNYYSECKLGQFVDFGWHPYRKNINIISGSWK